MNNEWLTGLVGNIDKEETKTAKDARNYTKIQGWEYELGLVFGGKELVVGMNQSQTYQTNTAEP